MTAYIATLEGDFSSAAPRRRYYSNRAETMDGDFWNAVKGMGKSAVRVIVAPVKGTAHAVMESGRGIVTGDIKRIISAPIRGVGHTTGEAFRGATDHMEYYWRPSKMSKWMGPAGAGLSAAAPFTGPAAPFLLMGGAALTVGGGVTSKVQEVHLRRQADRAYNTPEAIALRAKAKKKKTQNQIWLGVGAAALLGGVLIMTG